MRASSQHTNKKPIRDRSLMGSLNQSSSQLSHLATAMAAKIDMKPRRANMNGATPVAMAISMAGAVPVAVAGTISAAVAGTMTGAMATTMTVSMAGTMPIAVAGAMAAALTVSMAGAMPVAVAGTMTGAMPVAMTGMMISSLQCGGSEEDEAGGNRQDGDDPFHIELFLGLSFCRRKAVCRTDEVLSRLFS